MGSADAHCNTGFKTQEGVEMITEKDVYGQEPNMRIRAEERLMKLGVPFFMQTDRLGVWIVLPKPGFQFSPDFTDIIKIQTP